MATKQGYIRPTGEMESVVQRIVDGLLIAGSHYALTSILRAGFWSSYHEVVTVLTLLLFFAVGEINHLYRPWRAATFTREATKVWATWLGGMALVLVFGFGFKVTHYFSRVVTSTWFLVAPTAMIVWRLVLRVVLNRMRAKGSNIRTVALAGATKLGNMLAERILRSPRAGMQMVGYYDDREPERLHPMPAELGSVRGTLDDLVQAAKDGRVDLVYVALPLRAESRIHELLERLADTTASVYVAADFFVFDLLHAQWSDVQGIPVVSVFESPFYGVDGWFKRIQDLVLGTIILTIIAVPLALIALGVRLSSAGPIFFRQRRYGLNGQEIRILKFRTMTVCEDGDTVKQATKNDARVTRFGAFLRRTSLDELPQFFQVITGDMSIVGPRPHAVAHNEEFRRLIRGYMLRHKVKPGITGWAQVNGWRGETDTLEKMERRVEHDLEYIHNWNLLLDLKIILMTIFKGFTSRNAY